MGRATLDDIDLPSEPLSKPSKFIADDNSIRVWALISTILGSLIVFAGGLVNSGLELFAQIHVWGLTMVGKGLAATIGQVFEGSAYVNNQAWLGTMTQVQDLGVLAPWFMLLDLIIVITLLLALKRWVSP